MLSANIDQKITITGVAICANSETARHVEEELRQAVLPARDLVSPVRQKVGARPAEKGLKILQALSTVDALLEHLTVSVSDDGTSLPQHWVQLHASAGTQGLANLLPLLATGSSEFGGPSAVPLSIDGASAGHGSSSGTGQDIEYHAEMIFRMSWRDPDAGMRFRIRDEETKRILTTIEKLAPKVSFSVDGNMIVARGSMDDLKALRRRLLALGESKEVKGLPPGFAVDIENSSDSSEANEPPMPSPTSRRST